MIQTINAHVSSDIVYFNPTTTRKDDIPEEDINVARNIRQRDVDL